MRTLCTIIIIHLCTLTLTAQTMRQAVLTYLDNYTRTDQKIKRSTLDSLKVDAESHNVGIYVSGGFKEQFFTTDVVSTIYRDIRTLMPDSMQAYTLQVVTDGYPIEQLVPNAMRTDGLNSERLWNSTYSGQPWVKNTSAPWAAPLGLEGRHIALWQSHGIYWNPDKREWKWQRPRLFCTTEDLFTQTFVIPYIIPMLEGAGAVVYDTRERCWQAHEVIVDNDAPTKHGTYHEDGRWHTCDSAGFAYLKDTYYMFDNPFRDGTTRYANTSSGNASASVEWVPDIPADGLYPVYVAYQTLENSVTDAHYIVTHRGVDTHFAVNQQMGGGTWVYLGTFSFAKGHGENNKITLVNQSNQRGMVTADAVRIGSGMGNIARANDYEALTTDAEALSLTAHTVSGMPRWAEAARYVSQWSGMPDTVYNHMRSDNDYNNDLWARPETVNTLAGGSPYLPTRPGRGVPLELSVAFHSDAGFSTIGELIGSLSICTSLPDYYEGQTPAGISRMASYDLSSMLLQGLSTDMKKYDWQVRTLWNRNYCETREPQVPSVILEMLSHQNYFDLCLGYDPQFKFDFCRSVYKTIVKYLARQHGRQYVIAPLPVHNFAITLSENGQWANLTWDATQDSLETTAKPSRYVVYTRMDDGDFDDGRLVDATSCLMPLQTGHIYSFRVCAANDGGISFPSETLCAYSAPKNEGTILLVNAFTRLEGPARRFSATEQGFDLDADPGVPYGAFAGFCGRQLVFDTSNMGSEATTGTGYSGAELEGTVVMGNTFDYPYLHGRGIAALATHSFCSCSIEAFDTQVCAMAEYQMIDMIYGVQHDLNPQTQTLIDQYLRDGGRLLMSGVSTARGGHEDVRAIVDDKTVDGVNGSGLHFRIYRQMNAESYAVPWVRSLSAVGDGAFVMLQYDDNEPAAVAYDGTDHKSVVMGFPVESICDASQRDLLMQAVVRFLCR